MRVDELAHLFARYNVSGRQLRLMVEAYDRGEQFFNVALKRQASRGLIPPEVVKVLLDMRPTREELNAASRLVDYEFIKPFTEWWDELKSELERRGVDLSLDEVEAVSVVGRERDAVILELRLKGSRQLKGRDLEEAYASLMQRKLHRKVIAKIHVKRGM